MVIKIVIAALWLLAMVNSLPASSPFTVDPISVEPSNYLLENDGNGNYTIDVGADVRLSCNLIYTGKTWFLNWSHPKTADQHDQRSNWDAHGNGDIVSRDLYIKGIQRIDAGSYECHRKIRGGEWDDHRPYLINIVVGK